MAVTAPGGDGPRIIRIGLSPRIAGLTRREAQDYWRGRHAELFAQVPGLVSYVQNHAVLRADAEPVLGNFHFDIFSEVEFASPQAMAAAVSSPYYQNTVLSDEKRLLDASKRAFLVTERTQEGSTGLPDGTVKLAQFRAPSKEDLAALAAPGTDAAPGWDDKVTDIAGWPGIQPATVRQIPFASIEAVMSAHALMTDNAVLLSVIVRQSVIVASGATGAR